MTLDSNCHNLDAHLSHDLSAADRAAFESHLEACQVCRDELDQQQWLDDLLRSSERLQFEKPTAAILDGFRVSLADRRRRVLQVSGGLVVAATLLVAVGLLQRNWQTAAPSNLNEPSVTISQPTAAPARTKVEASFTSTSDAIVVPVESLSDDVTIVQVYPTTDTERRSHLELALTTKSKVPNGG